jgi:hypothetical protein
MRFYRWTEDGCVVSSEELKRIWADFSAGVTDLSYEECLAMNIADGYLEEI